MYVLQAGSDVMRDNWMNYLSSVIANVGGSMVSGDDLVIRVPKISVALYDVLCAVQAAAEAGNKDTVIKEGYVQVLDGSRWARRSIQVTPVALLVLADDKARTLLDSYPLNNAACGEVQGDALEALREIAKVADPDALCSILCSGARGAVIIQCADSRDRSAWLEICRESAKSKDSMSLANTSKSGYLLKTGALSKQPKERYFLLQGKRNTLSCVGCVLVRQTACTRPVLIAFRAHRPPGSTLRYFKKFGDEKPAGEVPLAGDTTVIVNDVLSNPNNDEYALCVTPAAGKRTYTLFATSDALRKNWVAHIKYASMKAAK